MHNDEPRPSGELENKIGYHFKDSGILRAALTHSSYYNEMKMKAEPGLTYNERLEFLGDSVLSVVVSSYLFEEYRNKQEGDLTKIRAAVVCEKALSKFAAEIGLGDYLFLGHGEIMNGGSLHGSGEIRDALHQIRDINDLEKRGLHRLQDHAAAAGPAGRRRDPGIRPGLRDRPRP